MTQLKEQISEFNLQFNTFIEQFFTINNNPENRAVKAAKYSVMNGGKRLRPFLVCETARLFGLQPFPEAATIGVALEMLHTYSLIHDDLPAMDNDTLRRGFPTCHIQFDEATAILAGDGLLTEAFRVLSSPAVSADEKIRCRLVSRLSECAGYFDGMIAGQVIDLYSEQAANIPNPEQLIKRIEELKTERLIQFACEAGAILGRADAEQYQALITYARKIGSAFQIADDILDIEGSTELMGKTLNKDAAQGKLTFVSLYGLEHSKQLARQLVNEAKQSLQIFKTDTQTLSQLADYMIERKS